MTYKSYPLFVFGFHGCDRSVAEKVLAGEAELCPSDNGYDWLGTGIYFWGSAPERALERTRTYSSASATQRASLPIFVQKSLTVSSKRV